MQHEPQDPFAGDPDDPARELSALDDDALEPLSPDARESLVNDLADLEVFQALLEPRGTRGLVVDCTECREEHFFDWPLLRSNLRALLDAGTAPAHEPPVDPDRGAYVTWDYARGFTDGVMEAQGVDEQLAEGGLDELPED